MIARLALLAAAGLALWGGVPLLWLWIGSQIEGRVLGGLVMLFGAVATIVVMAAGMGALTRSYQRARVGRGLDDTGNFPLEVTLVCSAFAAGAALVAGFVFLGS